MGYSNEHVVVGLCDAGEGNAWQWGVVVSMWWLACVLVVGRPIDWGRVPLAELWQWACISGPVSCGGAMPGSRVWWWACGGWPV